MEGILCPNIQLRPLTMSDEPFLKTLFDSKDVRKFYVLRNDHAADFHLFVQYLYDLNVENRGHEYIIELHDGTPVGLVGAELIMGEFNILTWSLSYAILPQYRNNGYATEAVKGFKFYHRRYQRVPMIQMSISEYNVESLAIARKLDFATGDRFMDPDHPELGILRFYELGINS